MRKFKESYREGVDPRDVILWHAQVLTGEDDGTLENKLQGLEIFRKKVSFGLFKQPKTLGIPYDDWDVYTLKAREILMKYNYQVR